jgi:hypothetical protein
MGRAPWEGTCQLADLQALWRPLPTPPPGRLELGVKYFQREILDNIWVKPTFASLTRLNHEQILTNSHSILLLCQKLNDFPGLGGINGDIDL